MIKLKRNVRVFAYTTVVISLFWLIHFPKMAASAIQQALSLCAGTLIPALFPYLVLSSFFVSSGCADSVSRHFGWIAKPFGLSDHCASAIVMGSISGYPAGAKTICELYNAGRIEKYEAESLLRFACNAGPAFFFGVVGGTLYHPAVGCSLFCIHLAAAFLCGLLQGGRTEKPATTKETRPHSAVPVTTALVQSVSNAGTTMLKICAFVLGFSLLLRVEQGILDKWPIFYSITAGISELSAGIIQLASTPIDWHIKYSLSAFFLGFGGLCVAAQTAALLQESGLPVRQYVKGKLLHGLISAVMAFPISFFLEPVRESAAITCPFEPISPWPWTLLPFGLIFLIFMQFPSRIFQHHDL